MLSFEILLHAFVILFNFFIFKMCICSIYEVYLLVLDLF